jgi:hypothetical protein
MVQSFLKSIAPVLRGAAILIEVGMPLRQSKGLWHLFLAAIIVGGKADAFAAKSFRCSGNRRRLLSRGIFFDLGAFLRCQLGLKRVLVTRGHDIHA